MARSTRLAHPHLPWIAAGLAAVLALPALGAGFVGDDYLHRAILLGTVDLGWEARPLWNLFSFVPAGEGKLGMMELGIVPWYAHPDLHLEFFRPLTALTHVLDYSLWPHRPALQHAHSLGWFFATVVLVGLLYRRVHGATAVAGLAALLFALEDAHHMPAGWLANRNALIAVVFGVGCVLAHIRWRVRGQPGFGVLAVGLLAVGQAAGEAAVGALAYLVAWQVTLDRGTWVRRLAVLAPYLVAVFGWRAIYTQLGYETVGSGLYLDPLGQPVAFGLALLERWPLLIGAQWLQLQTNGWALLGRPTQLAVAAACAGACLGLLALSWRVLRAHAEARFWAVGMGLALVPLCAAFPMDRLLIFAGVGAFGLMAMVIDDAGLLDRAREGAGRLRRWAGGGLLLLHGPLAVLLFLLSISTLGVFNQLFTVGADQAPADDALAGQVLFFVHGQEFPTCYTRIIRETRGEQPFPERIALLSTMASDNVVTRVDERTLEIEITRGLFEYEIDRLMRARTPPFAVGERVAMADFDAEVVEVTADGRPRRVRFRFHQPLESDGYRWVAWRDLRLQEWPLPAVGETVEVPAVDLVRVVFAGEP